MLLTTMIVAVAGVLSACGSTVGTAPRPAAQTQARSPAQILAAAAGCGAPVSTLVTWGARRELAGAGSAASA